MTEYISQADVDRAYERLDPILSTQFRRSFFGRSRLDRLERIHGSTISPSDLLGLILRKEGANLLAARRRRIGKAETSIRHKLLMEAPENMVRGLYLALYSNKPEPSQLGRIVNDLADYKWLRGGRGARLISRILNLPSSYAGVKEAGQRDKFYEIQPLPQVPPLKAYQRGILRELERCLHENPRVMVSAFTGTGKTRMGMEHAISVLESDEASGVVWIAQKGELLDQACDALEQLWPWKTQALGEALNVFRFMSGSEFEADELPDGPFIIIATSQQVQARLKTGDEFLTEAMRRSALLVVDEAHHSLAAGHQRIIEAYERAREDEGRIIGMSATPGRSNLIDPNAALQLAHLFGRQLIIPDTSGASNALTWFQDKGYLSSIEHREVHTESQIPQTLAKRHIRPIDDVEGMYDFTPEMLGVIGEDSIRNRRIVEQIEEINREGRHALVFCCNIEQAELLFETLVLLGIPCGVIHYKIDRRDRRNTIRQFRNGELRLLLNVEVLTTGFDAPKVDTIIMCRPTLSRILYEQMIGRGLRGPQMGGTETCTIVDFTTNLSLFNEPQAWEAFWEEWKTPSLFSAADDGPLGPGWNVRAAAPEEDD